MAEQIKAQTFKPVAEQKPATLDDVLKVLTAILELQKSHNTKLADIAWDARRYVAEDRRKHGLD